MNYFIADTHWGHEACLAYDNRKFLDIETHDRTLMENWNNAVGLDDNVYILGDISWYNAAKTIEIVKNLNGHKYFIKGNHDTRLLKNRQLQSLFVEICDYKELSMDDGRGIVLCHYPIPCFKNHYYNWIHLYGHVHTSFEYNMMEHVKRQMTDLYVKPCLMFNVGCMLPYMDYTPRTLEEILRGAGESLI